MFLWFPVVFLLCSYDFLMSFLWLSYDVPMIFEWFSEMRILRQWSFNEVSLKLQRNFQPLRWSFSESSFLQWKFHQNFHFKTWSLVETSKPKMKFHQNYSSGWSLWRGKQPGDIVFQEKRRRRRVSSRLDKSNFSCHQKFLNLIFYFEGGGRSSKNICSLQRSEIKKSQNRMFKFIFTVNLDWAAVVAQQ